MYSSSLKSGLAEVRDTFGVREPVMYLADLSQTSFAASAICPHHHNRERREEREGRFASGSVNAISERMPSLNTGFAETDTVNLR
jgi:hypothetical protein